MTSIRMLLLLVAALPAALADAKTIHVAPGPGTPLQNAINAAAPGDHIKLATGTYNEAVTINKKLDLTGPPFRKGELNEAVIDAGCGAATALAIDADGVSVKRVTVTGAPSIRSTSTARLECASRMLHPSKTSSAAAQSSMASTSSTVRMSRSATVL